LSSNLKDKEAAASVDCAILRRRRALNSHKWVPVKYIKENQVNHKIAASAPLTTAEEAI
jgi:hypothetical protein